MATAMMQFVTRFLDKPSDTKAKPAKPAELYKVGEYYADYSELSPEEISANDSAADALLKRSTIVSAKRGL